MKVLGIETSCDECSAAIVEDGKIIHSNIVATQIPFHSAYNGVVPEIASRKHTEWIYSVAEEAFNKAALNARDIDACAASSRPGLIGSLLVGMSFAKAFSYARKIPFLACDHILAHLYAPRMRESPPPYPFLGLLVSGGHTIICKVENFDSIEVLGTTIDDAAGEAFDKVSAYFGWGYPGGKYVEELAAGGDAGAFAFPVANLHKGSHRYDVSYSGLKTAVINQRERFRRNGGASGNDASDVAASFQKAAVDTLLRALFNAVEDTGIRAVVTGGGVASNSYLRRALEGHGGIKVFLPPLELCQDNAAMVAGIAFEYLSRGISSPLCESVSGKVGGYRRRYP